VSLRFAVGQGKWEMGSALYLWEGAFHFVVEQIFGSVGMVLDKHCCCWINTLIAASGIQTGETEWACAYVDQCRIALDKNVTVHVVLRFDDLVTLRVGSSDSGAAGQRSRVPSPNHSMTLPTGTSPYSPSITDMN